MKRAANHSPNQFLEAARHLVSHSDTGSQGIWPRAAAHLCRQALEIGLQNFWKKYLPGLENMPLRVQLICLPTYMKDKKLARAIAYTWAALSNACHHHVYELASTASELQMWIETAEAMLTAASNPEKSPGIDSGRVVEPFV